MCGISGLVGIESSDSIKRMVEVQSHRGPDDSGINILNQNPSVYFGHNRLSIIDLSSRGHQPMFNEDKSLCLVYNGEVYNFLQIKEELKNHGYSFFSRTDAEVILKAYDCWGIECLSKFNGMFAFGLYDGRRKKIILARDHLGIKPLYYWSRGGLFAFASEIKALLQVKEIRETVSLDLESFVSYVSLMWAPYTKTPFRSINRLPQGTFMELDVNTGKYEIKKFWELEVKKQNIPFEQTKREVFDLLSQSVKRQMIADVKVGAFLSGGLDSSAITVLMSRNTSEPIEAFTIAFSEEDQKLEAMMDDYKYAQELSEKFGFHLNKIEISSKDVLSLLPKIVYHLDEPVGDAAAINTYLIARLAKENGVTILLSGQGSDEIFGGYRKYLASILLERYKKLAPHFFQALVERILRKLPVAAGGRGIRQTRWMKRTLLDKPDDPFEIYYSFCMFIDKLSLSKLLNRDVFMHFTDRFHRDFFSSVDTSFINQMCYTDAMLFLPGNNLHYNDKATMAASIESRVPFVDHELVEYAFSLPDNLKIRHLSQKYILKKACEGLVPKKIIHRPKMPFSSPLRSWVKNGLKDLIDDYLEPNRLKRQGIFNPLGVQEILEEDRQGLRDNAHVIYGLLTMQIWLDIFQVRS